MLLDNPPAGGKPAANQCSQSFTHKAADKRCEIYDVRNQQPARYLLDLLDGSTCNRGLRLGCNFLWFPKDKLFAAYKDLVLVVGPKRLMHTPLVQKGSIATA